MITNNFIMEQVAYCREDLGLLDSDCVPTPIENLLVSILGYQYEEILIDEDFYGCSCFENGKEKILYNMARNWNQNFKRFTIAHELGHWYLHYEYLQSGVKHHSLSNYTSKDNKMEQEADAFAINLLAPKQQFYDQMKGKIANYQAIKDISNYFGISLIATAIRFVELSKNYSCALVCCNKEHYIEYDSRSSDFFHSYKHQSIRRGKSPHNRKIEKTFNSEGYLDDWYPNIKSRIKIQESFIPLGYEDKYIVLIEPESRDFDEDNEDF